jgi:hypothetical protein
MTKTKKLPGKKPLFSGLYQAKSGFLESADKAEKFSDASRENYVFYQNQSFL